MTEFTEVASAEKLIAWPTPQDYNEAVQAPAVCFGDLDLRTGCPELNEFGLPRPISGGFASVYRVGTAHGDFAVRCFLNRVTDRQDRYQEITAYLREHAPPWAVPCEFIEQGMSVDGAWYPIVKMQWVKGLTLGTWIEQHLNDRTALLAMRTRLYELVEQLQAQGIAHGDLQPANILIMQDDSIKLVDYDGMFVPTLTGSFANELGHRNFQHRLRSEEHFDEHLDCFSARLIGVALEILARDAAFWERFGCGDDSLMFRHADLLEPDHSLVFSQLEQHENGAIVSLARQLRHVARSAFEEIPHLDAVVEVDENMPDVEYTAPAAVERLEDVQLVPRKMHRPAPRRVRRSKGMHLIAADLAASMSQDFITGKRSFVYPTIGVISLFVAFAVGLRIAFSFYPSVMWNLFNPGQVMFADAHYALSLHNKAKAEQLLDKVIAGYNTPFFGINKSEYVEALVHKAEVSLDAGRIAKAQELFAQARQSASGLAEFAYDEEVYTPGYFDLMQLVCQSRQGHHVEVAKPMIALFQKDPEAASWRANDVHDVVTETMKVNIPLAVDLWNIWYEKRCENDPDNAHLKTMMQTYMFSYARTLVLKGSRQELVDASYIYSKMQQFLEPDGDSWKGRMNALGGMYHCELKLGDKAAAEHVKAQMKELDLSLTQQQLDAYAKLPPLGPTQ